MFLCYLKLSGQKIEETKSQFLMMINRGFKEFSVHTWIFSLPPGFVKDVARPDYWVPDHEITQCHQCSKTFTPAMSKHHCRACGQGVCGRCSTHNRPVPSRGWDHPVRVCDSCHARTDSLWALFYNQVNFSKCTRSSSVDPQKHCESCHCCSKRMWRINHTALNGRNGISHGLVWKDKMFWSLKWSTPGPGVLSHLICLLWPTNSTRAIR